MAVMAIVTAAAAAKIERIAWTAFMAFPFLRAPWPRIPGAAAEAMRQINASTFAKAKQESCCVARADAPKGGEKGRFFGGNPLRPALKRQSLSAFASQRRLSNL